MQKKGLLLFLLSFMFVGFASAQLSLGNMLNSVDDSTIVLGLIFVIIFGLVNFSLRRFFRNNTLAGGIAFAVALLSIWGINRSNFEYTGVFYNVFFFIPNGFLETIWPLMLIGVWFLLIFKNSGPTKGLKFAFRKGTGELLLGSGAILLILSFTGAFYEASTITMISIVLIGVGWVMGWLFNRKKHQMQHIQLH